MIQHDEGFSFLELLMVLALAAIIAGLALPSYRLMISKTHLRVATAQLEQLLRSAREAAIHEQSEVMICGSLDGFSCEGQWRDGQRIANAKSDKTIAFFPSLSPEINAEWRSNLGHNHAIHFGPTGLPVGQWGSFWLSSLEGQLKARITMNALGHLSVQD